ncbi:glycoside hydrolase [Anaeromyces robustus]|uniref:Glycoside hydrolase n=1 Tax=Anaeromyces robustus TaxID=1754192 RepID=A0A1Y1X069_9FUNG|nr:glycoside hydrolase [Anaeromyces robustus]|eukprot:ORX78836.1 glycoside hydrolase [Anaeromyces robustus]
MDNIFCCDPPLNATREATVGLPFEFFIVLIMSPQLSSEIDKVQVYSNFMFDSSNSNYWGVTVTLREDTSPRPPILGLPADNSKVVRRFRGDFTFARPGEYEFTLRATLNVPNSNEEHIWWAGKDNQNGKIIVKQASNRYEKDIKILNDVLIPTESIEVDVTTPSDPNILYSGFMKIPINSLIVSKYYPVDMLNWVAYTKANDWWLEPISDDCRNFQWNNKDAIFLLYQRTDGYYVCLIPISNDKITLSLTSRYHDGSFNISTMFKSCEYQDDHVLMYISIGKSNLHNIITKSMDQISKRFSINNNFFSQFMNNINNDETPFWKSIGWCTWNTCYKNVNASKVIQGLEEFKSLNIPIEYLIIDDGWQKYSKDDKLESFEPNLEKFPKGIDSLVNAAKKEYNVKYVGVWHTLQGYWKGISPSSQLASLYNLINVKSIDMTLVRANDIERFYNDYYSYLESLGIDFVKVDNQATFDKIMDELPIDGNTKCWKTYQKAIWIAGTTYFNARTIHSMAHSPNIIFELIISLSSVGKIPHAVFRNSDDFFPDIESSHTKHIYTNCLNNLWSSTLGIRPDWDMFQSYHKYGNFHAAARAISGGPIYISDELGKHDPKVLHRLFIGTGEKDDAKVLMYDSPALPCERSVFCDPRKVSQSLKIFNTNGNYSVIGMFNCRDQVIVDYIRLADVPNIDSRQTVYGVYMFNNRVVRKLKFLQQDIWTLLKPAEFELAWIVPLDIRRSTIKAIPTLGIYSNQTISVSAACFGLVDKYNGCLAVNFHGFTSENHGTDSGPIFEANLSARGIVGFFVDIEVDGNQRENVNDFMSVYIDGVRAPVGSVIYEKHYAAPAAGGGLLLVDTKLDNVKDSLDNINIEIHFPVEV